MSQAVPPLSRARRIKAGLRNVRLAGDLANAGQAIVGVESHDQHVLRAVGNLRDIRQAKMECLNLGDFHRCGNETAWPHGIGIVGFCAWASWRVGAG